MEELLRRLIEQNDTLIELSNLKIAALQTVGDKLDAVYSQLILNDVSSEVTTVSNNVMEVVSAVQDLGQILDSIGDKIDDVADKLEDS